MLLEAASAQQEVQAGQNQAVPLGSVTYCAEHTVLRVPTSNDQDMHYVCFVTSRPETVVQAEKTKT